MSKFFINRPIVAMVISIIFVILGLVAMVGLPVAQFPDIVPPEIQLTTTYTGADAETVEQSVATPIEQQISGVDNMNYMYSVNASNGTMRIFVNFDVKTDPNTDLIFTQMRQNQAQAQLPLDVRNYGVTIQKSRASPLMILALYSPKGTYDGTFMANYANINLNDQLLRVPGVARSRSLARDIMRSGSGSSRTPWQSSASPFPKSSVPSKSRNGQSCRTDRRRARASGAGIHLYCPGPGPPHLRGRVRPIVVRANPDGSIVRLKDVARIELGSQTYNVRSRIDGKPAGAWPSTSYPAQMPLPPSKASRS